MCCNDVIVSTTKLYIMLFRDSSIMIFLITTSIQNAHWKSLTFKEILPLSYTGKVYKIAYDYLSVELNKLSNL